MKRILSIAVGLLLTAPFLGIEANDILWLNEESDLGEIAEEAGPVDGEFVFVNIGKEKIIVDQVTVGCGCTDVNYPKKPIMPGDTAIIRFTFDPQGRPGRIDKYIKARFNDDTFKKLTFSGNVTGSASTLDKLYPYRVGDLRLETDRVIYGEMKKGMRRHAFVGVFNAGKETVTPVFKSDCRAIELKLTPEVIEPGQTSTLSVYLNTMGLEKEGLNEFEITGKITQAPENEILIGGIVIVTSPTTGPIQ